MAIKVKAVETLIKFSKTDPGQWRYMLRPELYTQLNQAKVIKEAALRSGISQGVMQACWDAAGEVIKAWATEGHSVALPGLGSMRFGLNAKAVEDLNKVSTSLITSRKIIFVPNVELKDELKNTAIVITCYDRNGEEVKRVISTDDAEVEDPEIYVRRIMLHRASYLVTIYERVDAEKPMVGMTNFKGGYITKEDVADTIILYLLV